MGYLNLVGSFVYKQPLFRAKLAALAANDAQLKADGWAQSTKALFFQATVPSGWTQDVSQNDKALRVVNAGGAGSGGSQALSTPISLAHSHTISADDSHTHGFSAHTHYFEGPGFSEHNGTDQYVSQNGHIYRYGASGATSINVLKAQMSSPGSITLGTLATHAHGGSTDSQLANLAFAYCDIIIGTMNAPGGTYTDLTASFHTGDIINFDPFSQFAANDAYTKANLMPGGTILLWGQTNPPAGWTRVISLTDRMLRVVSGVGGGVGGTMALSTGATLAHAHAVTAATDHQHSIPNHQHQIQDTAFSTTGLILDPSRVWVQDDGAGNLVQSLDSGATATRLTYKSQSTNSGAGNTDAAGAHTHVLPSALTNFILAYVDVIQCSKDSGGEPYPYTDLTAEFTWKKLVSYQRLNNLAKNDAMIQYHTTPSGSQTFFFMVTPPVGWTQILTQNDKCLRLVDAATGGNPGGGAQLLSQTIALAHTHSITAGGAHTHPATHTHPLDTDNQPLITAASATPIDSRGSTKAINAGASGGGFTGAARLKTSSNAPNETPVSDTDHTHGGATNSQLSDVVLAYADVIWCSKN